MTMHFIFSAVKKIKLLLYMNTQNFSIS